MKKTIISIGLWLGLNAVYAQQVPTNNNPVNGGQNNGNYWSRAGNSGSGGKINNIFGTKWNSPIYFITGGLTQATYRMRLNGIFTLSTQYPINGYTYAATGTTGISTIGYLALGYNMSGFISHNAGTARGPFSLLHLNGRDGTFFTRWRFPPLDENRPFIFQTDWNNNPGGINNGERMRIVTINAPGVPDPASVLDKNITRVAISHHGSEPITKPRSLLHLGYNTGKLSFGGQDGWRKWMDIGMFVSNGTDNAYFGLKEEKGQDNDRYDAVINWGDNQVQENSVNGPDNLRFIFTSTTTALPPGQGDPVS